VIVDVPFGVPGLCGWHLLLHCNPLAQTAIEEDRNKNQRISKSDLPLRRCSSKSCLQRKQEQHQEAMERPTAVRSCAGSSVVLFEVAIMEGSGRVTVTGKAEGDDPFGVTEVGSHRASG